MNFPPQNSSTIARFTLAPQTGERKSWRGPMIWRKIQILLRIGCVQSRVFVPGISPVKSAVDRARSAVVHHFATGRGGKQMRA